MNTTTNIILWSFSLTLALSGILFGIIASYNARRANKNIKTLISETWISTSSQRFFFKNLRNILIQDKKIIHLLKKENTTFFDYSLKSSQTRLAMIPSNLAKAFAKTEYNDISKSYITHKTNLDLDFQKIFNDLSILQTNKKIPKSTNVKLIEYHKKNILIKTSIIKNYSDISLNDK